MQCNIVICDVQHATFKFFGVFDFRFKTGPSKKIDKDQYQKYVTNESNFKITKKKLQVSKIPKKLNLLFSNELTFKGNSVFWREGGNNPMFLLHLKKGDIFNCNSTHAAL